MKTENHSEQTGLTGILFSLIDRWKAQPCLRPGQGPLTGNDSMQKLTEGSAVTAFLRQKRVQIFFLRCRTHIASAFERSLILRFLTFLIRSLLLLSARSAAIFAGTYCLSAAVAAAVRFVLTGASPAASEVMTLIVIALLSLPLMFEEQSVYGVLSGCGLLRGLFDLIYPSDSIRFGKTVQADAILCMLGGMILGTATWFFSLSLVPLLFVACMFAAFLLTFPEAGFLAVIAMSQFIGLFSSPTVTLAAAVSFLFLGFSLKLLRGKRSWIFSTDSVPFLLLLLCVLFSGTSGFAFAGRSAAITAVLMLGYLLALNLLRSEKALFTVALTVSGATAIISVIGIIQFLLGTSPLDWLDTALFPDIPGRTVSVFENPNMLGAYLTAAFPFTLCLVRSDRDRQTRSFGIFAAAAAAVCAVLTFSRGAWLGLLIGLCVYGIMLSPRGLLFLPAAGLAAAGAGLVFPSTVGRRLLNFFTLSDSANSYRVKVWNGAWRMFRNCFLTGIGAGDIAFRTVFLGYCVQGTETAPHSHSIYLQYGISLGILGLGLFVCFLLLLMKKTLSAFGNRRSSGAAPYAAAAFASVTAMAVTGIFDNVFYNYRVMFFFWCAAGIASAAAGLMSRRDTNAFQYGENSAELLLKFD